MSCWILQNGSLSSCCDAPLIWEYLQNHALEHKWVTRHYCETVFNFARVCVFQAIWKEGLGKLINLSLPSCFCHSNVPSVHHWPWQWPNPQTFTAFRYSCLLFQGQESKRSGQVIPWGLNGACCENGFIIRGNVYGYRLCCATDESQILVTSDRGAHVFLLFFKNKFIYLFLAALGFLCCTRAFSGCGYSLLRCTGFSLRWLLLLWSTGSRLTDFSSCSTRAQ